MRNSVRLGLLLAAALTWATGNAFAQNSTEEQEQNDQRVGAVSDISRTVSSNEVIVPTMPKSRAIVYEDLSSLVEVPMPGDNVPFVLNASSDLVLQPDGTGRLIVELSENAHSFVHEHRTTPVIRGVYDVRVDENDKLSFTYVSHSSESDCVDILLRLVYSEDPERLESDRKLLTSQFELGSLRAYTTYLRDSTLHDEFIETPNGQTIHHYFGGFHPPDDQLNTIVQGLLEKHHVSLQNLKQNTIVDTYHSRDFEYTTTNGVPLILRVDLRDRDPFTENMRSEDILSVSILDPVSDVPLVEIDLRTRSGYAVTSSNRLDRFFEWDYSNPEDMLFFGRAVIEQVENQFTAEGTLR